ncbi:MAG: RluA family pseudouridine synthase [Oscillospiraceae bacterium]|jgi:23S rRNA pseudouridine1911/1915/1917 synthase|nr:RluA family pseudouridine synthase [Oscillospiraceae bacterium]
MTTSTAVPDGAAGARIDVFLSSALPELSRSAAQRLLAGGFVTRGGKPVAKSHRVSAGEAFDVVLPEPEDTALTPQAIPLEIVYEDGDVVVVNKPRGMVVHPAPGHADGTLVNALLYYCGDSLSGIGGARRPGIVHRIDKDTSGLVIAAKNDFAHASLSAQLADRSLSRVYEAVVRGNVREDGGTVDAPIGRHPADRKKQAVTAKNSRNAVTRFEVVERFGNYTHVRCALETGRTHQIRVHLAHIGHPILGDAVYGKKTPELGQRVQCLHARTLKFVHPRTGLPIERTTELPEYFREILATLEKRRSQT